MPGSTQWEEDLARQHAQEMAAERAGLPARERLEGLAFVRQREAVASIAALATTDAPEAIEAAREDALAAVHLLAEARLAVIREEARR